MIWGVSLITKDLKTFIRSDSNVRRPQTEDCDTFVTDFLNPQARVCFGDTIKLHFDRFVHMQALPPGALISSLITRGPLKNVLIPVTEGAIQILEGL